MGKKLCKFDFGQMKNLSKDLRDLSAFLFALLFAVALLTLLIYFTTEQNDFNDLGSFPPGSSVF